MTDLSQLNSSAPVLGIIPDVQGMSSSAIRILRMPEVINRIGWCRASIYLHMRKGTFPKQITLGPRTVGWLESEIDTWLMARVKQSRGVDQH